MRASFIAAMAAICTSLCVSLVHRAQSQQTAPTGPGVNAGRFGIAVVDIDYIFEHHPKFHALSEQLKQQYQGIIQQQKQEKERIIQQEQALQIQFVPGTQEYKNEEGKLIELKGALSVQFAKQEKDFNDRRMRMFAEVYRELHNAVQQCARQKGLVMVFRFNGEPIDPSSPKSVAAAMQSPIFHQDGVDITPDVLALLKATSTPPAAAGRPQAPRR